MPELLNGTNGGLTSCTYDRAGLAPAGTVNVSTGKDTRKARAIRSAGRFSLCAQDERPPYKYVTVEGPATSQDATDAERLELARRYLGAEGGDAFLAANPSDNQVMIRMTPQHWLSVDYGRTP